MKTALLEIAINDYPGTGNDLRGCLQDMEDRRSLLALLGLEVTFRRALYNHAATLQWIRSGFAELAARPERALVINISTHGTLVPDRSGDESSRQDSAVVNYDFETAGFLLDDEIGRMLDAFPPGKVIFLNLDACHSAGAQRGLWAQTLQTVGWYGTPSNARPRCLPPGAMTAEALARTRETRQRLRLTRGRGIVSRLEGWLDRRNGLRYNQERVLFWAAAGQRQTADDAFIAGSYRGAGSWYWGEALKTLIAQRQKAGVKELPALAEVNQLGNKLLKQAGHHHQMQTEGREGVLKPSLSRLLIAG